MNQVTVFFEGLGLPRMTWNKTAFTLFGKIDFPWAALVLLAGIIAGTVFACRRGKKRERISGDDLFEVVLCGLLGSRLLYMIDSFGAFRKLSWAPELKLWGSVVLAVLFVVLICRFLRVRVEKAADVLAPAILLGLCIGAFYGLLDGNADSAWMRETSGFSLFGKTLALPSGEGTPWWLFRMGIYPNNVSDIYMVFVHPLFLYAAVWSLVGFVGLNLFARHKAFDGQVFLLGLIWFALGLIFVTGLSTAPQAGEVQWVAAVAAILALIRLIVLGVAYRQARKRFEAGLLIIVRGDSAVQ